MRILSIILITFALFCSCETDTKIEDPPIEKPVPEEDSQKKAKEELMRLFSDNQPLSGQGVDFALRFFKQASEELSEDNLFLSPYSLACALGMLYNGAEGETKKEIAAVLGMSDYSPEQLNKYYQTLTNGLLTIDPLTDLGVANAFWSDTPYPAKKNFADLIKMYYDAEVKTMDFSLPSSLDAVNNWCYEKTKGTIPEILDALIPPMVLANAVYFKSSWTVSFEKSETAEKPFHNQNGSISNVQMMHQKELLMNYTQTADYEVLRLPYSDGAFAMNILLPKEGVDIEKVVQSIDRPTWNTLINAMYGETAYVTLSMPRFTLKEKYFLSRVLTMMGMPGAFSGNADFSAMLDVSSSIGNILQKSHINVNEEGTEASAVTTITWNMLDGDPPPPSYVTMVVDRPFIFAISEWHTNTILFMGKVTKL